MASASVVLGCGGMGNEADEADFNAWVAYVSEHLDDRCGFVVDVEAGLWGHDGEDRIRELTAQGDAETVREALHVLWDEFCATPEAWPAREVAS